MTTPSSSARFASPAVSTFKDFRCLFVWFAGTSSRPRWQVAAGGLAFLLILGAVPAHAQNVNFAGFQTTVASGLNLPLGLASDAAGDFFVTQGGSNQVLEVTASGSQNTVPVSGLNNPQALAVDGLGDLFIVDFSNQRVVEVTPSGVQTTVPTSGVSYSSLTVTCLAADAVGDLFIADTGNSRVIEVTPNGVQTTVPVGAVNVQSLAVDAAGDVFLVGNAPDVYVSEVTPNGFETSVRTTGLQRPEGLAVDAADDLFISDFAGGQVVEITSSGVQTTIPVSGLNGPTSMALDAAGDLFIIPHANELNYATVVELQSRANFGDVNVCPAGSTSPAPCNETFTLNYSVVAPTTFGTTNVLTQGAPNLDLQLGSGSTCTGAVSAGSTCTVNVTFAPLAPGARMGAVQLLDNNSNLLATTLVRGVGQGPAIAFGPGNQAGVGAGLYHAEGLAMDGAGDVFVGDTYNNRVVEFTPSGVQTTVPAAGLNQPSAVAVDGVGDIFIADTNNSRVIEVTPGGVQTTVGSGLSYPDGLAVDGAGDVFIADSSHNRVVEVTPKGVQTTVGSGLFYASGLAVDGAGDLFVAYADRYVAEITASGSQTNVPVSGLGEAEGLAVDGAGDLFIADSVNQQVVELTASGVQATVGSGLFGPDGVAVDGTGDVFISDKYNSQVVEIQSSQPPTLNFGILPVGSTSNSQSVTIQNIGNQPLNAVAPGLSVPGPNFSRVPGSGTPADCASSFALTPGAACNLSVTFNPLTAGSFSNPAVFTDNALNASPSAKQSVPLLGTSLFSQAITFTTPPPPTAKNGGMFTVAASGGASGNPVTFSVGAGSVCTISGATYTMTSGTGFCYVVANQAGNSQYQPAPAYTETVTGTLTIIKVAPTVTLTGTPFTASYLSSFTVATTQNSGVTPTLTATPSTRCTISGNTVTMVSGTGNCTVKASWAANTYYLAATATQFTTAELVSSSVSWNAPAPITYGATLSAVLNATASVPGTFVYKNGSITVGASKVLEAGSYTLSCTFTPTLKMDYTTVTTTVPLVVNLASTGIAITSPSATITQNNVGVVSTNVTFTVATGHTAGVTTHGTVTVSTSGAGPTCTVDFSTLTGKGNCTLGFLHTPTGPYTVTATYSGDANHTGSNNSTQRPPIIITVNPHP